MKAFQQPDVVIVNEVNWTPTARMADIVLPATTSYERNDLTMAGDYSMMSIYPMKQVVPPQFEAKMTTIFSLNSLNVPEWKSNTLKVKLKWNGWKNSTMQPLLQLVQTVLQCHVLINSGQKINH